MRDGCRCDGWWRSAVTPMAEGGGKPVPVGYPILQTLGEDRDMQQLTKGGNTTVPTGLVRPAVRFGAGVADVSAYVLDGSGKVRGDADMIFFNQPATPDGAIALSGADFTIDLARVASHVERIAICATPEQGTVADLRRIDIEAPGVVGFSQDTAGMAEAAIIIGEFYRRNGEWKFRAVAQGFNGGLAPLSRHFGIEVADEGAPAPASSPAPAPVDLRKQRIVNLEKRDPKLVSLAKAAAVSLEKKSLGGTTAKVVLVLDISGSMYTRYHRGEIDRLVQRVLGLGLNMDDDGSIEVYAFGSRSHRVGIADIDNYKTFVPDMLRKHDFEGGTKYGATIKMIREDFSTQADFGRVPIYVMFVTDGDTMDRSETEKQIRAASSEGIFWQFMGIGGSESGGFKFLEKLDDLSRRKVDNCDFFSVSDPDADSDAELYDKLMKEYPGWLKAAAKAGILR
ncbi:VWA domain-containing protein [Croceibacterium xixiisoli]|nr:VWA domain-containing protein [Croceibacterium xixiisoli]